MRSQQHVTSEHLLGSINLKHGEERKEELYSGSQGGPSTNTTGQSAKKTGSAVTRGPTSRSKPSDSTARTPTTRSMTQGNASQTLIASTRKRKSSELTVQQADK